MPRIPRTTRNPRTVPRKARPKPKPQNYTPNLQTGVKKKKKRKK